MVGVVDGLVWTEKSFLREKSFSKRSKLVGMVEEAE